MPDAKAPRLASLRDAFGGAADPFIDAMAAGQIPMIVTDPRLPDNPIVLANEAFLRLTGYPEAEVLGRNCRFLQGPGTDPQAIRQIREALERGESATVEILNYRKDGTPYWCALSIGTILGDGGVRYFFGTQIDISARRNETAMRQANERLERLIAERTGELQTALAEKQTLLAEVQHRIKNSLQLVSSLLSMQEREIADADARRAFREAAGRINILAAVHERLNRVETLSRVGFAGFLRDLCAELAQASATSATVAVDAAEVSVRPQQLVPLALIANELIAEAVGRTAGKGTSGAVSVSLRPDHDGWFALTVADNGDPDADAGQVQGRLARQLIEALTAQLGATVRHDPAAAAPASIVFPIAP